jgi:exosortase family protein XrtF
VLYEFVLKPQTTLDEWVMNNMVEGAEWGLEVVGLNTGTFPQPTSYSNRVGVSGTPGVEIGAPCDGLSLFALFAIFIAFFPGSVKRKSWYIPLGILFLHFVNIFRVISLAVIQSKFPDWLSFNHDYTFTVLVYGVVFGLWYVWATYLASFSKAK